MTLSGVSFSKLDRLLEISYDALKNYLAGVPFPSAIAVIFGRIIQFSLITFSLISLYFVEVSYFHALCSHFSDMLFLLLFNFLVIATK